MRRALVEAAIRPASILHFEDVLYTHAPGPAVTVRHAISGVEIAREEFDISGGALRACTHVTRALRDTFPNLARGDLIDDGNQYQVLDWGPPRVGDGRLEIEISLKKL